MRKPDNNSNHGLRSTATETAAASFTAAEEEALAVFSNWLDGEFEQLVARWSHLAAPNASRRERFGRRML